MEDSQGDIFPISTLPQEQGNMLARDVWSAKKRRQKRCENNVNM
jgi:hypothetical protein